MACLRKRKKTYYVDFRYQGKRYAYSTKTSNLAVAKKILVDIENKIAKGTFNLEERSRKQTVLSVYFEEYFVYAKGFKAPETISNEKGYAKKFIEFVGDCDPRTIDSQKLDMWKAHVLSKYAPTTFNIERRFLQAALNIALKWGYIESNPIKLVQKVKVEEKRLHLYPKELTEVFKLINSDVKKTESPLLIQFRNFVEFLLLTGLRRGEAIGLQKEDIDFVQNRILIRKTKTKLIRYIPLHPKARKLLLEQGEKVFSELREDFVTKKFCSYLTSANLSDFKLHSLRHTFATALISRGVDIYTVSRLLGHTDIKTTMVYAKVNIATLETAIARLRPAKNF